MIIYILNYNLYRNIVKALDKFNIYIYLSNIENPINIGSIFHDYDD